MPMDFQMAFYGGTLIALASSLNYVLFGNITGMSGILSVVLSLKFSHTYFQRLAFVVGLVTFIDQYMTLYAEESSKAFLLSKDDNLGVPGWTIGGLLIGIGTRWGGGCTSGHGVCGLPRLSIKSLLAVCIFMTTGIITATFFDSGHLLFVISPFTAQFQASYRFYSKFVLRIFQVITLASSFYYGYKLDSVVDKMKILFSFTFGGTFGMGLLISGMCSRGKILGFLQISDNWDGSLIIVMFTAVLINFVTFQSVILYGKPLLDGNVSRPDDRMDIGNFFGPALFGMGWGITGLCPGPAIGNVIFNANCLLLIAAINIGQRIVDFGYEVSYRNSKKIS